MATGPDADELTRINGKPAKEPVRVYAGLQTADTDAGRMSVLLSELERTHAFDRKLLVIVPTTGTGWVNPVAARALEMMYNGDTAMVALQYSYLPSWISFVGDTRSRWIPAGCSSTPCTSDGSDCRPTTGQSCCSTAKAWGRWRARSAFGYLPDISRLGFDSVLWVGPPNASPLWRALIQRRDPAHHGSVAALRQRAHGAVLAGRQLRRDRP